MTRSEYLVGVDLGTSSCKAVAFDMTGRRLAAGRAGYPTSMPQDRAARQDPESWWTALCRSVTMVTARLGSGCRGIGLSGQIGTHLLADEAGTPLADAWTWQDGRAADLLTELDTIVDPRQLAHDLETWLPAGAAWPLPRLLWVKKTYPELLSRAQRILQPKDLLIHRLTGEFSTDASSWRGLAHPDGHVHHAALDALGIDIIVPPIQDPTDFAGTLLPHVAEELGLLPSTPVFVGWNDFNCALVGTGVVDEGDTFDIAGTSEHIGVLSAQASTDSDVNSVRYDAAANPGTFVHYGVTSNGGSVAAWLQSTLLGPESTSAELADRATHSSAGAEGLAFVPYLQGERSPIWNAKATGAYVGLRVTHTTEDLLRAGLEGVAYNLRQIRDVMTLFNRSRAMRASGGPATMALWNQIKASVLDTQVAVMQEADSAALGAVVLAAVGVGHFASITEASRAMTHIASTVDPIPDDRSIYDEGYARFREIYPALAGQPHRIKEYNFV